MCARGSKSTWGYGAATALSQLNHLTNFWVATESSESISESCCNRTGQPTMWRNYPLGIGNGIESGLKRFTRESIMKWE